MSARFSTVRGKSAGWMVLFVLAGMGLAQETPPKPSEGVQRENQDDPGGRRPGDLNTRATLESKLTRVERAVFADKRRAETERLLKGGVLPVVDSTPRRLLVQGTLELRARVVRASPPQPADILHSYGYGGSLSAIVRGRLGQNVPVGPWTAAKGIGEILRGDPEMKKGDAAPAKPAKAAAGGVEVPRELYLRIEAGTPGTQRRVQEGGEIRRFWEGYATGVELELELLHNGKPLKTLRELGPDGGSFTFRFPFERMKDGDPRTPEFLSGVCGILEAARERTRSLADLPWGRRPVPPRKYAIVSNLSGYGKGRGHDTSNVEVMLAELECMQQLGINGLRGGESSLLKLVEERRGVAKDFARSHLAHMTGYPVPREARRDAPAEEVRCPSHPGVRTRTQEGLARDLEHLRQYKVDEVWALTVDEIGAVTDAAHLASCRFCIPAFQEWVRQRGYAPGDFGKSRWDEVKPVAAARPEEWKKDPGLALAVYATADFRNVSSARLFGPFRDAFNAENEKKRKALEAGEAARQPWLYTYSLRGSNYVRGGSSIDYFDWYRLGENAFVWETTERDKRVGAFTSLLCDVQRAMAGEAGLKLGIYVKPHRAQTVAVPRTLAAVSRGVEWIYWYTYGPEWGKGDNFCRPVYLQQVSKAARLLAAAEEATYGASWAVPAEVAWVSSGANEKWRHLHPFPEREWHVASWEDAKWTYVALSHAHVPLDVLDEGMLEKRDLSRYKVMYLVTPTLRRASARKVEEWVKAGGTLVTTAWGLVYDEAQRPLDALHPVLGLRGRSAPETWCAIQPTSASGQQDFAELKSMYERPPHDKAALKGGGPFGGAFKPMLGRETLSPAPGTETLAAFADGTAAVTRKSYGRGQAYVVGFWPGIEYSHRVRREDFDMTRDFDPAIRAYATVPALERTRPVVDAGEPCVEGVLLRHGGTGRRAVTLANWAARTTAVTRAEERGRVQIGFRQEPARFENLKVRIRGAGPVARVTSAWLQKELPFVTEGDEILVTLPQLEEGDILLLD